MSLPHALLTSLLEQPCSGMDLARRFGRSIGFFWPATHQQIYKELGKLLAGSAQLQKRARVAGSGATRSCLRVSRNLNAGWRRRMIRHLCAMP